MSSEHIHADRFLGEFRELKHGRPDGPSLHASIRSKGDPHEEDFVHYLRGGSVLAATGSAVYDVLSPTNEMIDALHLLTDGEWFWHTDLAHYVDRYHVPLDDRFVDHARTQGWLPPQLSEAELTQIADAFFPENEDWGRLENGSTIAAAARLRRRTGAGTG